MTHMLEMTTEQVKACAYAVEAQRKSLSDALNRLSQGWEEPMHRLMLDMALRSKQKNLAELRALEVHLRNEADMDPPVDWLYAVAPTQEAGA